MASGQPAVRLQFEGIRELDRALGKADKELRKELRRSLKDSAGIVADEARSIAGQKGLRASGDLIRGIRPFAASGRAGVRSSAKHGGFNYPKRLEYDKGGLRATLGPALEHKTGEVVAACENVIDRIADDFNHGAT